MRIASLLRTFCFAFLLFCVTASPAMSQATNGRVVGTVEDENGEVMAGVTITAEVPLRPSLVVTSDDSGRFSLIGFPSGQFSISATFDGYQMDTGTVSVTQSNPGRANFVLIRIRSGFELFVGEENLEGLDAVQLEADLESYDAAFEARDYDAAITGYNDLLSAVPTMTFLYLNIGNAYRGKGDNQQALDAYQRLIDDPDHGERAETEIARTRLSMGDLDAASGLVDVGEDASREDLYNLGEVDFARGDVDSAAGWYEKASVADPNWEKPWFKLALVALNKGDMDTAKQHFQKVVELAPSSEEGAQAQATLSALP